MSEMHNAASANVQSVATEVVMKRCGGKRGKGGCGEIKPLSAFGVDNSEPGGRNRDCKRCRNKRWAEDNKKPEVKAKKKASGQTPEARAKRKAHLQKPEVRARINERQREVASTRKSTIEGWAKVLLEAAKRRSTHYPRGKKREVPLPFDPDPADVVEALERGVSALSGLPFDLLPSDVERLWNAPSLDQIVAGKGYAKSNRRVILTIENRFLGRDGDEIAIMVAGAMVETARNRRIVLPGLTRTARD